MTSPLTLLTTWLVLAAAPLPSPQDGLVLSVKGTMIATRGDSEGRKTFELTVLLSQVRPDGAVAWWLLGEQGQGGWSWPDRFGRLELDANLRATGGTGPALLYDRGDGKSQVPVVLPLLSHGPPLAKDATWEADRLEYRVMANERRQDQDTWRVEARTNYGVKRTFWVDATSPLVLALKERVFIGQGQEYDLRCELTATRTLPEAELTATTAGWESLLNLRSQLGHEPRDQDTHWNDQQLAQLKAAQASLAPLGSLSLLTPLVKAIELDLRTQKGRSGAVASLREKVLGQPVAADLKLDGIGHPGLDRAALTGKVTVLHFWEYRDTPLEEPYGQVGFLDFLHRQRQGAGVAVYGVAVHEAPEGDSGARRRATAAAGRLRSFMNLSYPLLVDDGSMLRKFGDPRVAGAKLPLWVVIDPQGKVVEYHSGHYEVQRDRGLEALDALITQAAKKGE